MVGLMQIMIYMLAVYLVFKGFEIFQIALMSNRENRWPGLILGGVLIGFAVLAGIGFSVWGEFTAQAIGERMNSIPGLPR